jgi:polysaccharide biosynthesis transport protein
MEHQPLGPRFDARDYVRIIRKRILVVIIAPFIVAAIGALVGLSRKTEYRATAQVAVKQVPKNSMLYVGGAVATPDQPKSTISLETQARFVKSPLCAAKAQYLLKNPEEMDTLSQIKSDRKRTPIDLDISGILESVNVTVFPPETLLIEAHRDTSEEAMDVANAMAAGFEQFYSESQSRDVSTAVTYLENQLGKTRDQLNDADRSAYSFQQRTGLVGPEVGTGYAKQALDTFRAEKARAEAELAQATAGAAQLEAAVSGQPAALVAQAPVVNPDREALAESLRNDQLALARLRADFTEQHPAVQALLARIAETQARMAELAPVVTQHQVLPNTVAPVMRAELETQRTRVKELQAQIGAYDQAIANLHTEARGLLDKESVLARLQDERQLARDQYKGVLQELSARRLAKATSSKGDIMIGEAANAEKVGPNLARTVIFFFLIGIFVGIATALVLETLDDTIHTPEDISRHTPVAFLGLIPWADVEQPVTFAAPKSPPAEAFRTLRSNINFALVESPAQTFVVTSAGASEGKTSVVTNLAIAFAQSGQSVIVVDSDLRRPSLHRQLSRESTPGLTNVLVREMFVESVLQDTEIPNLRIMAAGPLPPNPAELVDSARMDRVIEELRKRADIVIFDTPPCIMLTDALILASKVDRVILVAEAGRVSRDAFNEMVRLVQNARGDILGTVLNKIRLTSADYYYYYSYYYYGGEQAPRMRPEQVARRPEPEETVEAEDRPLLPWERPEWMPDEDSVSAQPPAPAPEAPRAAPPAAERRPTPEPPAGSADGEASGEAGSDEAGEPPLLPWDRPRS